MNTSENAYTHCQRQALLLSDNLLLQTVLSDDIIQFLCMSKWEGFPLVATVLVLMLPDRLIEYRSRTH